MPLIEVDDLADPCIEPYRALRDRDLATRVDGRPGVFVAEGEVVLRMLLSRRSRARALSVLVARNRLPALSDILPHEAGEAPVYVAAPELMSDIVGFPIHRGVLALGERPDATRPSDLPPEAPSLVLVLVGLANHDNVGAAFRNAAAFGADAVFLDGTSCDPLYRKAIRVSVGAALTVPFARGGSADAVIEALATAGYAPMALSPAGATPLGKVRWPRRTALVVGAEGAGLPKPLLARLPTIRIDMSGGSDSLNVATASGIALHAARGFP